MARSAGDTTTTQASSGGAETPKIRWDTSNVKSAYTNVCSVTSTREEVVLNFGVNKTWERGAQECAAKPVLRGSTSPEDEAE